jgi:hypothetical protein
MVTKKAPKNAKNFECDTCDFICTKNSDFLRHNLTRKHEKRVKCDALVTLGVKNTETYNCDKCSKKYFSRNGLWSHSKKCYNINKNNISNETNTNTSDMTSLTNLVLEVVKQNQELTKQIVELSKNNNIINNNCTTNNKFNLQFFLNEQCKDALNITDFVNSLPVSLTDLENVGSKGFIHGISNIFVNGLKELDIYKRPLHCSDVKREILYIKDEDKWEKENDENQKLKNAIIQISNKNIKQIPAWVKQNPSCKDSSSKKNNEYLHLISNSMSGSSREEEVTNIKNIIKNIAKEVIIDK